jgi:hypothetical protein
VPIAAERGGDGGGSAPGSWAQVGHEGGGPTADVHRGGIRVGLRLSTVAVTEEATWQARGRIFHTKRRND